VGRVGEWVGEVLKRPIVEGRGAFEREGGDGNGVVVTAMEKKRRTEMKIAGWKAIGGIGEEWK
jgi:hypothetical protein